LTQVQTLEQMCCNSKGSVQGFTAKGKPVYEPNLLSPEQIKLKEQIQLAATDLLTAGSRAYMALPLSPKEIRRDALGLLGRLLLHPTQDELNLYERFSHDINNGTQRRRFISNVGLTREALVRGGLISFNEEYHKMFANDLVAFSPALTAFRWSKARFGLRTALSDFADRSVKLQAIISYPQRFEEVEAPSFHTHDGYRVALLSIEPGILAAGINLGKFFSWVQIHSAGVVSRHAFGSNPHWTDLIELKAGMQVIEGAQVASGLIHFPDSQGFLHLSVPRRAVELGADSLLVLVYRPVEAQQLLHRELALAASVPLETSSTG
jgi:hypothetical protein